MPDELPTLDDGKCPVLSRNQVLLNERSHGEIRRRHGTVALHELARGHARERLVDLPKLIAMPPAMKSQPML